MSKPWTPPPWRLTPYYKPTRGGYDIEKKPAPNRWQGIVEPIPNSEYGCRSFVVGVGIQGQVDDYWLSIKDANARLIAAAPELVEALEDLLDVVTAALRSGDWKVDGACDPDASIRRARSILAKVYGQ